MCDIKSPDLIISTYSKKFIRGKKMDVLEEDYDSKENTAFEIFISRDDIFNDMLSEFSRNVDISYLLDVTFIGEEASDMGGPRREFLTLALQAIKERLIKDGYLVSEKDIGHEAYLTLLHKKAFEIAGIVVGLSLLEGGPVPYLLNDPRGVLLTPDTQEMKQFSIGLKRIGILQLCQIKKDLMSLFDMNNGKTLLLTYPTLVKLLKVKFSEEGSNGYIQEKSMYRFFLDYMKEVAAHRRGSIQLSDILKFITGIDQVPILGFTNTPTIEFTASDTLLPTSSTCTCTLNLSRKCDVTKDIVFNMFDYAFANSYFGLV
ncbi:uncharacterized protein LOC126829925 [Patella vulgata]|uniref:uncharacterized protein LOC126829925 n=1 Tax=Patella vulgata TaxID=6465 RepID=UPI002180200C|nr:uncharacterized protein LOC126829925 [Patella vulgata]XP_050416058.1 uncharacterized protein LOC126829925 [Patella vulgata]